MNNICIAAIRLSRARDSELICPWLKCCLYAACCMARILWCENIAPCWFPFVHYQSSTSHAVWQKTSGMGSLKCWRKITLTLFFFWFSLLSCHSRVSSLWVSSAAENVSCSVYLVDNCFDFTNQNGWRIHTGWSLSGLNNSRIFQISIHYLKRNILIDSEHPGNTCSHCSIKAHENLASNLKYFSLALNKIWIIKNRSKLTLEKKQP